MLFVLPRATAQQGAATDVITHTASETVPYLNEYWTEERMRNAQPLPLLILPSGQTRAELDAMTAPSGPPFIVPSAPPGTTPSNENRATIHEESMASPEPFAGTHPFVYTSYQLFPDVFALYKQYPYRVIGKVFFTKPGVGDFVCSGAIVNTPNNMSSVWTAGHCVYDPDLSVWHTNFVFVPARRIGVNPYAIWTARTTMTLVGWTNGLLEYDHGGASMNRGGPGGGKYLVGALGALGFAADWSRQQHWHAGGYPAESPFDGEHQHYCASTWSVDDQPSGDPANPPTIGIGCDMTGGSSGGPWILNLSGVSGGTSNLLNGNVSYGYVGVPDEYYGPYFTGAAISLYGALNSEPIP